MRAIKEGFAPAERTHVRPAGRQGEVALHPAKDVPARDGVGACDGCDSSRQGWSAPRVTLPGFWMDRHEVTNRQFKAFIDADGYQKEEYLEGAVRQGRTHAVMAGRRSRDFETPPTDLGRPAGNWASYPDGAERHACGWCELVRSGGLRERLPARISRHCTNGGESRFLSIGISDILRLSNFASHGVEPVGANRGMAGLGAYDMAGNVKEWVANPGRGEQR